MIFLKKFNVNDDSSHAFYLGVELARAQIALCNLEKIMIRIMN